MDDETTAGTSATEPGWNPDPYHRHELRYWDGFEWTDQVRDGAVTALDPPEVSSPWAAMAAVGTAPSIAPEPAEVAAPTPTPAPAPTAVPKPPPAAPAPAPAWTPPPSGGWSPVPVAEPAFGAPAGFTTPAKRHARRWWLLGAALVVAIVAGVWFLNRPPDRIDARPPAAPPAGYRLASTDQYRFAIPASWQARVITDADRERLSDQLDEAAPGAGDAIDEATEEVDGTMMMAADPVTRDNVNVIRFPPLDGSPSDPEVMARIRGGIDQQMPGSTIHGLTSAPADVHGFPAATLTYGITVGSTTLYQVATVIQTGDHVFQLTVTASSPERAAELSRDVLPTFEPL